MGTATGAGARPEGFATTVGTEFQFIAKPKPGWSGIVDCVVLEVDEPRLLRYSWTDHGGGETTDAATQDRDPRQRVRASSHRQAPPVRVPGPAARLRVPGQSCVVSPSALMLPGSDPRRSTIGH